MLGSTETLLAQYIGKKFISGSAGVNFNNSKPEQADVTNSYGYNFDLSIGKFKTNTKAVGWRLSNTISGGKQNYSYYDGNEFVDHKQAGIRNAGVGVGRFWQFYKHFNDQIGIYAGPNIDVGYSYGTEYSTSSDNRNLYYAKDHEISLSAGLSAGIYYHFSRKWWVTASLAFSNPIFVDYSFLTTSNITNDTASKQRVLKYAFSPNFTFPSVGFGLRYFCGR